MVVDVCTNRGCWIDVSSDKPYETIYRIRGLGAVTGLFVLKISKKKELPAEECG